jgi:signal transduction histidine kinase
MTKTARRWVTDAGIASLAIGYGVSVWRSPAEFDLLLLAGLVTLLSVAELSRALNARTAADRRERAEATARRASEERLAIARDLHDVVAHSISVINVQANTALHLMDRQPERAREALTAIREVGGQALGELGTVLGALRDAGGSAGGERRWHPCPGWRGSTSWRRGHGRPDSPCRWPPRARCASCLPGWTPPPTGLCRRR